MVLIDCGISNRQLQLRAKELDVGLEHVSAAIFTHEHSDHVNGLPVFAKRYAGPLYATKGTISGRGSLAHLPFVPLAHDDELTVAGMRIRTFPTSHDVADPFGLRFSVADDDGVELDALGWCTDTGYLTDQALQQLHDCRILGIESNHDPHMLATGPYPPYLQARVGGTRGHLSNNQTAQALPQLVTSTTDEVVALHISEKNNTPQLCLRTLADALGAEPIASEHPEAVAAGSGIHLHVANQVEPLSIW
jgi:phosphoribosyl 1,2-cyclic phosphodiesterase